MPFGIVLKNLRTKNKMTQRQLADTLGVSESRIGMYERCQREPDFEMLEAIADYFNVDMDFLTGRSDVERQYTFTPPAPKIVLSSSEEELVGCYRCMNAEGQTAALAAVRGLAASGIYKKRDDPADLLDHG